MTFQMQKNGMDLVTIRTTKFLNIYYILSSLIWPLKFQENGFFEPIFGHTKITILTFGCQNWYFINKTD